MTSFLYRKNKFNVYMYINAYTRFYNKILFVDLKILGFCFSKYLQSYLIEMFEGLLKSLLGCYLVLNLIVY
jgi:hypothetical protein